MSNRLKIKTEDSERWAKELLAAAKRLEKKYPALQEVNSGIAAVRQRYEGVCKEVLDEDLDRKGSLIGGAPFLSEEYPALHSGPLVQLDLDDISRSIGESVGSGLLQAWMAPGAWGQEPWLLDLDVFVIPREAVDSTDDLLEYSFEEDEEWLCKKAAELEVLKVIDPERAEEDEEIYQAHYWSGMDGFDWALSEFSTYKNWYKLGRFGAPQQIVAWKPAGFTIPPTRIDPSIWDLPDDFDEKFPSLQDEPDYETVCRILGATTDYTPKCALFDIYYDFCNPLYGNEIYAGEDSLDWNWLPLFAFPGPLSDRVDDQHLILYRKVGNKFEYSGASMRWNWH